MSLAQPEDVPEKPRYDFFTVLPEMEVVVPEQAAEGGSSQPQAQTRCRPTRKATCCRWVHFRQAGDADQMKANLALLGMSAKIQTVNVNGATWHRVRIGPSPAPARPTEISADKLNACRLREQKKLKRHRQPGHEKPKCF